MTMAIWAAVLVLAVTLGACDSVTPEPVPTSTPLASPTDRPTPTPPAVGVASASPVPALSLNDLDTGDTELSLTMATAICEPEPAQGNPDAGRSTIGCTDALVWALTGVRTRSDGVVTRMFLDRPRCPGTGCSDAELNEADVYVWLGDETYDVGIDMRALTATVRAAATDAPWPTSSGSAVPPVTRANVKASLPDIAERDAMPFCGRTVRGDPESVQGCFRDAVVEGRPAEMIDVTSTAHGERIVRLFRYTGTRPVEVMRREGGVWRHYFGSLRLGIMPSTWDFIPWGPGVRMDLPG